MAIYIGVGVGGKHIQLSKFRDDENIPTIHGYTRTFYSGIAREHSIFSAKPINLFNRFRSSSEAFYENGRISVVCDFVRFSPLWFTTNQCVVWSTKFQMTPKRKYIGSARKKNDAMLRRRTGSVDIVTKIVGGHQCMSLP